MAVPRTFDEKMEILDHCMQLEKTGGDILGYLWSKDYITPRATWFNYQRIYLKRRPYEFTDGKPKEKGENDAMKMPNDEERAEAMRIAMDSGNPRDYLGQIGCKNPTTSWKSILQYYRKHSPGVVEMLPSKLQGKAETPEMPTVKLDGPLTIETPEAGQVQIVETPEKPKKPITQPLVYDGMTVREIEGLFGRYRRTDINGLVYVDFENPDRADILSYTVDQWKKLRIEQENAFRILGVEL